MKAVPRLPKHWTGKVWVGSAEMSRSQLPSPTIRDAGGEHDPAEKPKGIGAYNTGRSSADSLYEQFVTGARARRDHVHLRRPAARKETGAKGRQANPDPPANGKAPRTWCVCRWPNSVAWQHA